MVDQAAIEDKGRSPRTRGSLRVLLLRVILWRSIPAYAGEPRSSTPRTSSVRVDPRVRGGADRNHRDPQLVEGRSPRTRGSQRLDLRQRVVVGSIPAYAGEPDKACHKTPNVQVDPRVRGGATRGTSRSPWSRGRSPRTRGSHAKLTGAARNEGSIPAYAGEPLWSGVPTLRAQVDPRVRGGAIPLRAPSDASGGRSPRTRGSLLVVVLVCKTEGSIPAYAGEPRGMPKRALRPEVDPRVRGGAWTGL